MKSKASRRRRGLVGVAMAVAAIVFSTSTAHAIPLFKFVGIVTDALDRPLANVKVTDGTNAPVYTGSDGRYALEESSLSTYTLRASRTDTLARDSERQTVTLPLDRTVDFTPPDKHLLYRVSSILTPSTVTTATAGATINLSITSWAPQPATTCVNVRDTRTGIVAPATYLQMIDTVRSSWGYTLSVPQGAAQGSYSLVSNVTDCASGTPLTSAYASYYTIDNTPPMIDRNSVIPLDRGNTAFVIQPLSVVITDTGGAGLNLSSIRIDLTDTTETPPSTRTFTGVSYNSTTRRATVVDPGTLDIGHSYSLTINASDAAGNPASPVMTTFSVLKVEPTVDPLTNEPELPTATVPPTPAARSTANGVERVFTFENLPLQLTSFELQVTGTPAHAGFGYIEELVRMSEATIVLSNVTTVNGQTQETVVAEVTPANWPDLPVLVQWRDINPPGTVDPLVSVTSGQWAIEELTFTTLLPGNKATVRLSSSASVRLPVCANPTAPCGDDNYPTPDPMPYYFSPEEAAQLLEAERAGQQGANDSVAGTIPGAIACDADDPVEQWQSCAFAVPSATGATRFTYQALYNPAVADDYGQGTWDIVAGAPLYHDVLYGSGVVPPVDPDLPPTTLSTPPLYRPVDYVSDCATLPCTEARALNNSASSQDAGDPEQTSTDCVNEDTGINKDGGKCYQFVTFVMDHLNGGHVGADYTWQTDPWKHHQLATMKNTKGWNNADEDNFSVATNQVHIGRDHGPRIKRAYFKVEAEDVAECRGLRTYQEWISGEQSWRQPSPGTIDLVDMKQGYYYTFPCGGRVGGRHSKITYAEVIWVTDTCVPTGPTTCDPKWYNDAATVLMSYGHKKKAWSGEWSCGAGAPTEFGCSYGGSWQDENHWERHHRDFYAY